MSQTTFFIIMIILSTAIVFCTFIARIFERRTQRKVADILQKLEAINKGLLNYYISIDEKDFQCLVSGGILNICDNETGNSIKIVIKDFGFNLMHDMIGKVEDKKVAPYTDRERRIVL